MTVTELLETVCRVDLRTNRLVKGTMVGACLSHFKGHGRSFVSFSLTPALSLGERIRVRGNAATFIKIGNRQSVIENFP
jgi:hypothetical protein